MLGRNGKDERGARMAFGIKRHELLEWKQAVTNGQIAILTHFWEDERFPGCTSVTKIGCVNVCKLMAWGKQYDLKGNWIHQSDYPHFDVFGEKQKEILLLEGMQDQMERFCSS
jgi:hypothetical protein